MTNHCQSLARRRLRRSIQLAAQQLVANSKAAPARFLRENLRVIALGPVDANWPYPRRGSNPGHANRSSSKPVITHCCEQLKVAQAADELSSLEAGNCTALPMSSPTSTGTSNSKAPTQSDGLTPGVTLSPREMQMITLLRTIHSEETDMSNAPDDPSLRI